MRGSGKIFAVSCGPTAVASSVVSGSAIVALASRRLSERSLIALQIDFVLCCCDAQVVATKGQTRPRRPPPWHACTRPVLPNKQTHRPARVATATGQPGGTALAPLRSTSKRASSSPAVMLNMRREIKRIDVSALNVDRLDGNLFLYRHPRSVSSIVFISGRTLESVLCGVHSKQPVTPSLSVMDVIERYCHMLFAHT